VRRSLAGWLPPGAALAALAVAGCTCEAPPSPSATLQVPTQDEDPTALPRATRSDLPAATPALELELTNDGFAVDTSAIIATWPPADRERAAAAAPPGDATWPLTTVRGAHRTDGLVVPELGSALERARDVELARSGDGPAPTGYALRAGASVPWGHVLDALYTAGQAGWAEPHFVLRAPSGDGRVQLVVPLPRSRRGQLPPASAAAVFEAERVLAEALGEPPPPRPAEPAPATLPLLISIEATREVRVRVGARHLAPGCATASETAVAAVPGATSVDREALVRCLDAARPPELASVGTILDAARDLPYGEVAPILELLAARDEQLEIGARL
jgi:hypothetical protein